MHLKPENVTYLCDNCLLLCKYVLQILLIEFKSDILMLSVRIIFVLPLVCKTNQVFFVWYRLKIKNFQ